MADTHIQVKRDDTKRQLGPSSGIFIRTSIGKVEIPPLQMVVDPLFSGPIPVLSFAFNEGTGLASAAMHGSAIASLPGEEAWVSGPNTFGSAIGDESGKITVHVPGVPNVASWTALTVAFWFHPSEDSENIPLAFYHDAVSDWFGVAWHHLGRVRAWLGSHLQQWSADDVAPGDTWTHVAVVWSGSTLRVYADGAEVVTELTVEIPATLHHIDFAGAAWDDRGGSIDDFRLYNSALNPEEINEIKDTPL